MSRRVKRTVEVLTTVEVILDEEKFTPEFLAAFKSNFYDLATIEEHAQHIARARVAEIINDRGGFLEGYGNLAEMGIAARLLDHVAEVAEEEFIDGEDDLEEGE